MALTVDWDAPPGLLEYAVCEIPKDLFFGEFESLKTFTSKNP